MKQWIGIKMNRKDKLYENGVGKEIVGHSKV